MQAKASEDEGTNYRYEQGQYSTIQFKWNDKSHTLTIGKRNGSFPGMLISRKFIVRVVGEAEKCIDYNGKKQKFSDAPNKCWGSSESN